jgi:hypothetical protein
VVEKFHAMRARHKEVVIQVVRARLNASSFGTPSAARASKTNAIFATG